MLECFVKWLYGYLYVRIKGNSPERFINLCNVKDISLWNIEKTESGYGFMMGVHDFRYLLPIARKTKTRPYIIKRKGFPFYIKRIKPRKGLWMGGLLFFLMIYFLSTFIWEIQVQGEYTYTEELLLRYLESIDVYAGMRKEEISCPEIERAIRETYTDIGWVSAELKGSKLIVRIQETNMPTLYEEDGTPGHLVASRDGIVDSIMTRTGTPLVKKGDEVKKGDILISGIVELHGDGGELLKKEAVRADGDVIICSETSYYNEVRKKYTEKSYTEEKVQYQFCIGRYRIEQIVLPEGVQDALEAVCEWGKETGQRIQLELRKKIGKNGKGEINGEVDEKEEFDSGLEEGMDIFVESKEFKMNPSLKLPIRLLRKTERKYVLIAKEYRKEEMERILQEKFEHYLEKLSEKGVIIGENSVKIVASGSFGTISGTFEIFEKADGFQKVGDNEWRMEEIYEYSGNNN